MTMRQVDFPYHDSTRALHLPEERLKAVLTSAIAETAPLPDPAGAVLEALRNPIGTPPLRELAKGKKRVLIVTSDHTRPVPSKLTLPVLTGEILLGEPRAEITILVATGLHRATTRDEQLEKFGREIVERFPIVVHDAFDAESCVPVCTLPSGADFEVNRLALETDLLITEGFIEPHFFAGYSGGRKSILPGICSYVTVVENHSAKAIAHPQSRGGVLEGNIIHEDMIYAAKQVDVAFTLNVALNAKKEIVGAFAGELDASHLEGTRFVDRLSRVPAVEGDVVFTSNGGLPLDQNLYQCPKAASTALECLRPGGVLVIVASCCDGLGGEHFAQLMTAGTPREIYDRILATPPRETIPEQWCAQTFAQILLEHPIVVVSDFLDPETVRAVNMIPARTPDEALELALGLTGPEAEVVAIPDGVSVIAVRETTKTGGASHG